MEKLVYPRFPLRTTGRAISSTIAIIMCGSMWMPGRSLRGQEILHFSLDSGSSGFLPGLKED